MKIDINKSSTCSLLRWLPGVLLLLPVSSPTEAIENAVERNQTTKSELHNTSTSPPPIPGSPQQTEDHLQPAVNASTTLPSADSSQSKNSPSLQGTPPQPEASLPPQDTPSRSSYGQLTPWEQTAHTILHKATGLEGYNSPTVRCGSDIECIHREVYKNNPDKMNKFHERMKSMGYEKNINDKEGYEQFLDLFGKYLDHNVKQNNIHEIPKGHQPSREQEELITKLSYKFAMDLAQKNGNSPAHRYARFLMKANSSKKNPHSAINSTDPVVEKNNPGDREVTTENKSIQKKDSEKETSPISQERKLGGGAKEECTVVKCNEEGVAIPVRVNRGFYLMKHVPSNQSAQSTVTMLSPLPGQAVTAGTQGASTTGKPTKTTLLGEKAEGVESRGPGNTKPEGELKNQVGEPIRSTDKASSPPGQEGKENIKDGGNPHATVGNKDLSHNPMRTTPSARRNTVKEAPNTATDIPNKIVLSLYTTGLAGIVALVLSMLRRRRKHNP